LNLQDILLVLFKHKWKILACAAIGITAAAAKYFLNKPLYESQAKLLVRYVVDRSAIDPEIAGNLRKFGDAIDSEVQIFTSWDLSTQVAEAIGAKRLLPEAKDTADTAAAAHAIRSGLTAIPAGKDSGVIMVSYKNHNPELAIRVLDELIGRYFVKHLEVHRSAEAFNFVTQQSDQVRARLNQTEEDLKQLKSKAGINSLTETTALINAELASTKNALQSAKAEHAEQQARVQEIKKTPETQSKGTQDVQPPAIDSEAVQRYQALIAQLDNLRQAQMELLAKYSEKAARPEVPDDLLRARQVRSREQRAQEIRGQEWAAKGHALRLGFVGAERDMALAMARERYRRQNDTGFDYQVGKKDFDTLVKEAGEEILGQRNINSQADKATQLELVKINQMRIENLERQRSDTEKRLPEVAAAAGSAGPSQRDQLNLLGERAHLAGIEARTETLESHLRDVQKEAEELSEVGPQILQLERAKEIEESNYKYFQASLEKARIDEALDPSKMPNISVVQKPSPAMRVTRDLKKAVVGLAGGGVAFGLALAFLIELVLDRSVKGPVEVEKLLGAPILLSIPYLNGRSHLRLRWPRAREKSTIALRESGSSDAAPWETDHFIRPYSEAIRDRLVLYFEINRMNHKPKLVAVTGCSEGAGASTLAGGLAAALSETGDGKVLLVDMNVGRPEIHPFFRGAPACSLTEALVGEPAQAGENLYLATATPPDAQQAQLIPRKFYGLMPHLKASDFDYIIFDMPPFSQTSITLPISRFMDKVVIVAEAEKSSRDVVKRAKEEFTSVGTSISVILNKSRSYLPRWIGAEG
jgi:uncharacterized protein involved in exopolysaccharide biosynthesis/Mrp family chromosome partitioning ATPase